MTPQHSISPPTFSTITCISNTTTHPVPTYVHYMIHVFHVIYGKLKPARDQLPSIEHWPAFRTLLTEVWLLTFAAVNCFYARPEYWLWQFCTVQPIKYNDVIAYNKVSPSAMVSFVTRVKTQHSLKYWAIWETQLCMCGQRYFHAISLCYCQSYWLWNG